ASAQADAALAAGTSGALGAALRARGRAVGGEEGIEQLAQAADVLGRTPLRLEHGWALHDLGAALRRTRRRADAREPLRAALATFERLGATAWAERAVSELRATGQASGRRSETASSRLTPHELQVALLVSQGMTNREVAAALFLSPKTIEYHLGQIYRKLDVRGRAQLARLMAMELPEGERDPAVLAAALS
ncbi:MAG TPA: helix-turn-helix transcriptional regulator, partial [Solirubrobacter sp.]|nr:helix-turn-helix transcriptional regulator [Solirubrobacter sp.]